MFSKTTTSGQCSAAAVTKQKWQKMRDLTWDLVPLGGNVNFLVDELYFIVVKTIRKYSF